MICNNIQDIYEGVGHSCEKCRYLVRTHQDLERQLSEYDGIKDVCNQCKYGGARSKI